MGTIYLIAWAVVWVPVTRWQYKSDTNDLLGATLLGFCLGSLWPVLLCAGALWVFGKLFTLGIKD